MATRSARTYRETTTKHTKDTKNYDFWENSSRDYALASRGEFNQKKRIFVDARDADVALMAAFVCFVCSVCSVVASSSVRT